MHLRIVTSLAAIAVALFVQVGMCPNCTFGLCGMCEAPVPVSEPVEKTHGCCQSIEEQPQVAESDTGQCDVMGGCKGECTMKRAIEDNLWSQVKAFHFNGFSSDELLVDELVESGGAVLPSAEHSPIIHPPPALHCCISSTVLLL